MGRVMRNPTPAKPGQTRRVLSALMCPPMHYTVCYSINPWMNTDVGVDRSAALHQWMALVAALEAGGVEIEVIKQAPSLPDMVFTSNAGLVYGNRLVLSRFGPAERRGEEPLFARWFVEHGFRVDLLDETFEGAGDAFVFHGLLLAGHGQRSTLPGIRSVAERLGLPLLPLHLIDPRFFHLDTCLSILDSRTILWYPDAFDREAGLALRSLDVQLIAVSEREAMQLGCNALTDGQNVYSTTDSLRLSRLLDDAGFTLHPIPLGEFLKGGGGVRCLALPLVEVGAEEDDVDLALESTA